MEQAARMRRASFLMVRANNASTDIGRTFRGMRDRRRTKVISNKRKREKMQHRASMAIQKYHRGKAGREHARNKRVDQENEVLRQHKIQVAKGFIRDFVRLWRLKKQVNPKLRAFTQQLLSFYLRSQRRVKAALLLQRHFRGTVGRRRAREAKVDEANSRGGVMLAMPDTKEGRSGFYQAGDEIYRFRVTEDGEWELLGGPYEELEWRRQMMEAREWARSRWHPMPGTSRGEMLGGWYQAGIRDWVNHWHYSDTAMAWVRDDGPYSVQQWEDMMQQQREEASAAFIITYFFLGLLAYSTRMQKMAERALEIAQGEHIASSKLQASVRGRRDRRVTQRLRNEEAERQRLIAIEKERVRQEKEDFENAVTRLQAGARGIRDRRKTKHLRAETMSARQRHREMMKNKKVVPARADYDASGLNKKSFGGEQSLTRLPKKKKVRYSSSRKKEEARKAKIERRKVRSAASKVIGRSYRAYSAKCKMANLEKLRQLKIEQNPDNSPMTPLPGTTTGRPGWYCIEFSTGDGGVEQEIYRYDTKRKQVRDETGKWVFKTQWVKKDGPIGMMQWRLKLQQVPYK